LLLGALGLRGLAQPLASPLLVLVLVLVLWLRASRRTCGMWSRHGASSSKVAKEEKEQQKGWEEEWIQPEQSNVLRAW
jgi:hypothetical protein